MGRWRLAGFDLDGTLVRGSSVLEHVGGLLGYRREAEELTRAYNSFKLDNHAVTEAAAHFFAGQRPSDVSLLLRDLPTIGGIAESLVALRRRGIVCLLCTITFRFAAEYFSNRFGFDSVTGCELEVSDAGVYTGRVGRHVEAEEKRDFVVAECQLRGWSPRAAVYVGDSRSDIPTFGVVGFSVALNASRETEEAATTAVRSNDLRDALAAVPGLLGDSISV